MKFEYQMATFRFAETAHHLSVSHNSNQDTVSARVLLIAQAVSSAVLAPFELIAMIALFLCAPFSSELKDHAIAAALTTFAHLAAIPISLGLIFVSDSTLSNSIGRCGHWYQDQLKLILQEDI